MICLKNKIFLLLVFLTINISANKELTTVADLKIESYLGTWYQIASIPAWFQRKCVGETTAEYRKDKSELEVINTCVTKDGSKKTAVGRARINKKYKQNSKLQVTFVNIFKNWVWLFSGDYWVIEIDKNYQYSIVGSPKRDYLWILSRTPSLDKNTLIRLEKNISAQGYDTCQIKITQEGEYKKKDLCLFRSELTYLE